jgi:hydroxyacylglutathione hydrolase
MIKVDILINDINNSNCYLVQDQEKGKCIVIDPGSRNADNVLKIIQKERFFLEYIILTHSHFDHIAGTSFLSSKLHPEIISSRLCSDKIQDPIRNLSYFTDFGIIVAPQADICIEDMDNNLLQWNDIPVKFYHSPGHTKCSILVQIEKKLFTGDTLLKGIKSKVTQPDGNREELKKTLRNIYETIPGDTLIFPGHGESFMLETQDLKFSLNK